MISLKRLCDSHYYTGKPDSARAIQGHDQNRNDSIKVKFKVVSQLCKKGVPIRQPSI
jgi:hypothetical protein